MRCEETVVASLLERLEAREQAARVRVEALRAEMDRLAEQVAAEQELLGRLEITRQTVIEILAGDDVPGEEVAGSEPKRREGMRIKLKRLVGRGWLVEVSPGLFACAAGVAGGLNDGD